MFNFLEFIIKIFSKKSSIPNNPGLVASPQDFRDVPLSAVSKVKISLPENYSVPYELTIKSQGSKPHCVGYSCSTMKDEKERREQNFVDFDGSWIYEEAKKIDGMPDLQGTYFRAGLKVLKDVGAKIIGKNDDVSKYRIGAYVQVNADLQSIKQAIYEHGVVLGGYVGSNEGWDSADVRAPKSGERQWGHAVSLVGWKGDTITIQNSWGKSRGDNGHFYATKEYLPFECWAVIVDLPADWKDLLKSDSQKPSHTFNKDLHFGVIDSEVKILQDALKWLGCMDINIQSVENFGIKTKASVTLFQQRYGIWPQVGYFGPLSRAKMNDLLK